MEPDTPTQYNDKGQVIYTIPEFAQLLKRQYPNVASMDDYRLVGQYLQKYPQFKTRVHVETPSPQDITARLSRGPIAQSHRRTLALKAAGTAAGPISGAATLAPVLGQVVAGSQATGEAIAGAEEDPQILSLEKTNPELAEKVRRGRYFRALPFIGAAAASGGEGRFGYALLRSLLGGMAGRAMEDVGRAGVGSPETPQTLPDLGQDIITGGAEQGAYEVAGRTIAYPFRRVATGVMNRASRTLPEEVGGRYGIHFTPGQVSRKTIPSALERRAEYNPFAREMVEAGRTEQKESANRAVTGLVDRLLGTTPANIGGKRTQAAITDIGSPIFKRNVDRLQSILNARVIRVRVNTLALKAEAQHELSEALQLVRSGQGAAALTTAQPASGRLAILQDIVKLPDAVPFSTLMQLRTKWMGIGPQTTELLSNEAKGTAKHYVQRVTQELDDRLRGTPAMVDWLKFRNFTRRGAEVFESDAIVQALNREPEKAVNQVGPKDITNALRMRRAVVSYAEKYGTRDEIQEAQRGWRNFQNTYVRDQILAPLRGDMTRLSERLDEFKPQVLNTIFSDARSRTLITQLRQIGKAMERINQDVRVMHGHEVMTVRAYLGAAGAVPIAKVAYSPTATKFYLRGLAGLAEASRRPTVRAGGRFIEGTSPYLGRAFADIARAYALVGLYKEPLPQPTGEMFKEGEEEGGEEK
jgi:hypothetical protein